MRISLRHKIIFTLSGILALAAVLLFAYLKVSLKEYPSGESPGSIITAIIIIGLSAVIVFNYALLRLILKPISEISAAAVCVRDGNFSKRAAVNSNDEIGDLSFIFNNMADTVSSKIKHLTDDRARMEAVLLNMYDGVMVLDADGKILLMNRAIKNMLSVEGETKNKRPIEVIRNVDIQDVADKVLKIAGVSETAEISVRLPREKKIIVHTSPVMRGKDIEGAVLVFHDITDIRRLEKLRKDFVANVSHELRTPVSNIKGFSETLLDGAINDSGNAAEFVKIIADNADRLARLIEDLLDLSKIESGKSRLNMVSCSPAKISAGVISQISIKAEKKKITINNKISDDTPNILADEISMSQVLFNLMDNAVNYTGEGGNITLEAAEENVCVRVSVKDSGIGIADKDMPRVFERFYRVDRARSREIGGTGLGLSIVKHIIDDHGGGVFVESVLGHGSTFSFTIPKY